MNWLFQSGKIEELFWARPVSNGIMIAAFAAVVLLTIFLYWRRQGLPAWVRIALAATRLVVWA
jgi:hypothetical protein